MTSRLLASDAGDIALATQNLEEAIRQYEQALEVYTREAFPERWAMTQNNLGNVLWNLGERESNTARLEQAVEAFQARGVRQGKAFDEQCRLVLQGLGFEVSDRPFTVADLGVEFDAEIRSQSGRVFWCEFKGSWHGPRPGLRRTDTVKKALADAFIALPGGAGTLVAAIAANTRAREVMLPLLLLPLTVALLPMHTYIAISADNDILAWPLCRIVTGNNGHRMIGAVENRPSEVVEPGIEQVEQIATHPLDRTNLRNQVAAFGDEIAARLDPQREVRMRRLQSCQRLAELG